MVPSTTPSGFEILAAPGGFTIGVGRMYVDGILAENHGVPPTVWDPRLAEVTGTAAISFFEQPYLPFNDAVENPPADVFNRPVLAGGPHLVYLDVWQREVTHLEDPELVEKAVGVDTTARLQTVWQVRVLQNPGTGTTCATDDDDLPDWPALIRPSGARLTTSTGDLPDDPNPCLVPPAAGYKGTENQLYRVEIHRGGPQATATFKWSRDNATVATRVTEIHGGTRLVVESLGRDDVLGFHPGDWIEIIDDWHELHGRPGQLRRIRPGDGIVTATRSILFDDALPAGLFPVDGQGRTDATRHTRIRRWDQSNQVRRADGTVFHNLNASASSNGIPVPPPAPSSRSSTASWSSSASPPAASTAPATTGRSPPARPTAASTSSTRRRRAASTITTPGSRSSRCRPHRRTAASTGRRPAAARAATARCACMPRRTTPVRRRSSRRSTRCGRGAAPCAWTPART